ncbi:MAG: hypothetical protein ACRD18_12870 [Terriglobia bacterium]
MLSCINPGDYLRLPEGRGFNPAAPVARLMGLQALKPDCFRG